MRIAACWVESVLYNADAVGQVRHELVLETCSKPDQFTGGLLAANDRHLLRQIITGQVAWWSRFWLVEPINAPSTGPLP